MRKLFSFKLIFIAIFLLLTIAIRNCENFQFRNLDKEVSKGSDKSAVDGSKTKIRYPFRKLEFSPDDDKDDDDDDSEDIDDDEDDDDEEEEELTKFKFAKVHKGKFEVKKRPELRFKKLAQFRDSNDDDKSDPDNDDEDESEESGEKKSFFSKIISRFTSYFKREENDEDQQENSSAEDNENNDDSDDENKPMLAEMFDKFKSFLEARNQKPNAVATSDEDDDNDDESSSSDNDDNESESMLRNALRKTFTTFFNRTPFNLVFDFDDSDDDDTEVKTFEDSEEDELNYQKLLKQEREQEEQKTEKLITPAVEEETPQLTEEPIDEPEKSENLEEEKVLPPTSVVEVKKSQKENPKKSKEEVHLAQKQFEKLLLNLPSFIPDYAKVKSPECQKQGGKT